MYVSVNFILFYILFNFGVEIEAVVGGNKACDGEFPFQVSLKYNGKHNCGGTILNEDMVLTAAHCVRGKEWRNITIVAGATNIKTMKHSSVHAIVLKPDMHPAKLPGADDIALLKVFPSFQFDEFRNQVTLPEPDLEVSKGQKVFITGWGVKKVPVTEASDHLRKAEVYALEQCNPPYIGEFCATTKLLQSSKGVCKGDSGGPVTKDKKVLVGVIAGAGFNDPLKPNSYVCGSRDHPDRFVKVTHYLNWIHNTVESNSNFPLL